MSDGQLTAPAALPQRKDLPLTLSVVWRQEMSLSENELTSSSMKSIRYKKSVGC